MPDAVLTFLLAAALLSLAPGPDNLFVLMQSTLYGPRAGLLITLGLCTGLMVHTVAVALGVSALFMLSATAFTALKGVGAAYLLYLAWRAFRAAGLSLDGAAVTTVPGAGALYRRGIIMNLSNPKVAVFFLAFLPQFTTPGDNMTQQLLLLGLLFIAVAWLLFSLLALLSGVIPEALRRTPGAQSLLHRLAGVVFIGLAIRLATTTRF